LNWNTWVRQFHRWVSVAFTVTVIANFGAMGLGEPPAWVVYSPLLPLFLLLFTKSTDRAPLLQQRRGSVLAAGTANHGGALPDH